MATNGRRRPPMACRRKISERVGEVWTHEVYFCVGESFFEGTENIGNHDFDPGEQGNKRGDLFQGRGYKKA